MRRNIENLHQKYIENVLQYDLNPYYEMEELRGELSIRNQPYKDRLLGLRIVLDRVPYFEDFLHESVKNNEITDTEEEGISSYIQISVERKMLLADFTNLDGMFYELYAQELKLPSKEHAIWAKFTDIAKQVSLMEEKALSESDNQEEYKKLSRELNELLVLQRDLDEKVNRELLSIARAFEAENIADVNELKTLCQNSKHKKIELLIVKGDAPIDPDLAAVIQMRAKAANTKGGELIVISFDTLNTIIQSNPYISGITKLSFLHHVCGEFGYVDNMSDYIDHHQI
ncbi:hypothetical protein ACQUW5_15055 [Legionella sp. CNM-1927-20]|uniref:hypothetical protein n=1 Tax=Legionella sp. CNM-1927-20 TaxID=3422221 RepID=UPI00403ACBCD